MVGQELYSIYSELFPGLLWHSDLNGTVINNKFLYYKQLNRAGNWGMTQMEAIKCIENLDT